MQAYFLNMLATYGDHRVEFDAARLRKSRKADATRLPTVDVH